jgi:hypothetical protein
MKIFSIFLFVLILVGAGHPLAAQETVVPATDIGADLDHFFDDALLMEGYAKKLSEASKEVLLSMLADESLNTFKKAATVRVFRDKFASQIVGRELILIERLLLRQMELTNSSFVQIEIMHTLLVMDRYRYFDTMMPVLVRKMDHYDPLVDTMAYNAISALTGSATRSREARIVFNTLRKMFFLSRKKLQGAKSTDERLHNRLQVLRWAIKILGTEELKKLPKEVIGLM